MSFVILPVLAIAVFSMLVNLWWRRRTRLPDDRPHCPHCYYDIEGAIESHAASAVSSPLRCPECGRIVINPQYGGQRKNGKLPVKYQAALASLGFLPLLFVFAPSLLITYGPISLAVWIEERDARFAVLGKSVEDRAQSGELSNNETIWLKNYILGRQGSLTVSEAQNAYGDDIFWPWGEVFWQLYLNGGVTDAEIERFVEQSLRFGVRWPINATPGSRHDLVLQAFDLPFYQQASPLYSNEQYDIEVRVLSIKLSGRDLSPPLNAVLKISSNHKLMHWTWDDGLDLPADLSSGKARIQIEAEVTVLPRPGYTHGRKWHAKWQQQVELR